MPSVPSPHSFYLRTPDGHRLHVQQHGPAGGEPWLVLHGGPGSGCQPGMAAWFDPVRHRAIMPDQRGAGRSTPAGTLRRNTVGALLADLEQLRRTLGIERWGVVGGSWGATLALAYAARYPQAVAALVLRGTFLTARADVDRLFLPRGGGRDMLRRVTPQGERLPDARAHLLTVSRVLHRGTTVQKRDTAAAWRRTERGLLGLGATAPAARQPWREQAAIAGKYRIQAHYLRRRAGQAGHARGRAVHRAAGHSRDDRAWPGRCRLQPGQCGEAARGDAGSPAGLGGRWTPGHRRHAGRPRGGHPGGALARLRLQPPCGGSPRDSSIFR